MYQRILLAVDLQGDTTQDRAIETAIELARTHGGQLHVMTVVPNFGMSIVGTYFPKDFEKNAFKAAQEQLHAFTAERIPDEIPLRHIITQGTIYERILATATEIDATLIVVGSHRPELKDYLIGPNSARVVRHALCSVLIVRE
jgi:nucleotide-binding universal stress UspA family protein